MADIFKEGEVVHNLTMPTNVMQSEFRRKNWAMEALAAYVKVKHGIGGCNVERSHSRNGKVTGTQVTFMLGGKEVTYMLVEPNSSRGEVHIVRSETDLDAANILDVIDYTYDVQAAENRGFNNKPFGALAALKAA